MTTVTSANSATQAANNSASSSSSSAASSGLSSDFQTFLTMLTAQMQNQDPLNPIDSSDYAVQLATFSGVEQQVKTNDLLESLATQLGVMGMSQLAGWVGMEARVPAAGYYDGDPVTLAPNPVQGADQTILVAYDAAGNEAWRGTVPVSTDPYEWTGLDSSGTPLPTGLYDFKLESYNNGTLLSSDQVEVYSRIVEAQGTASGTVLVLQGGVTVGTTDITALREPA